MTEIIIASDIAILGTYFTFTCENYLLSSKIGTKKKKVEVSPQDQETFYNTIAFKIHCSLVKI